jgi:C-terminal processing protease CtpA/Prc
LGISWRTDDAEPGSVFLTRVVEGTPAAAADLAVHDRIYELDGQPFADADAFQSAITTLLDSGQPEFTLVTERRGHTRTVTVKMPSIGQGTRVESQGPKRAGS